MRFVALAVLLTFFSQSAFALCGATNYEGTQGRLYDMVTYIVTCCVYTLWLTEAIAAVLSIYGATQVYIKMQTGEDGIMKSMMVLIGAILFLLGAAVVLPGFFGFSFGGAAEFNYNEFLINNRYYYNP